MIAWSKNTIMIGNDSDCAIADESSRGTDFDPAAGSDIAVNLKGARSEQRRAGVGAGGGQDEPSGAYLRQPERAADWPVDRQRSGSIANSCGAPSGTSTARDSDSCTCSRPLTTSRTP